MHYPTYLLCSQAVVLGDRKWEGEILVALLQGG